GGNVSAQSPSTRSARSGRGRTPDDLAALSMVEAGELLRTRKISPVELTNACLARIDRLNPALNAFITVMREQALADAKAAKTETTRVRQRGPLHGIPIALKDLFDTAGVKTTAASAIFADPVAGCRSRAASEAGGRGADRQDEHARVRLRRYLRDQPLRAGS